MALPNIELYEALKKDMSEESARMIAEVVPGAGDIATKGDIAELRSATKSDIAELKSEITGLKAYVDSRLLRYTTVVLIPLVVTMLGTVGALIALVVKT